VFSKSSATGTPEQVQARIDALVRYLETMQVLDKSNGRPGASNRVAPRSQIPGPHSFARLVHNRLG